MFFYLSKAVWLILQPSSLILIVLLLGLLLAPTRRGRCGVRLLWSGVLLYLVCGFSPLGMWLALPLEERFQRADLTAGGPIAGIIVLGGAEEPHISSARGAQAFNEAGERMTEAVALARRLHGAKVIFTGGSGAILYEHEYGATSALLFFKEMGLEADRLMLESRARNTWENAILTRDLVKPKPGERYLLVTSAWHMPRAVGTFRKAGFAVEPWPVDYRTAGPQDATRLFDKASDGLARMDIMVREWIGLLAYRLSGYCDTLFPGPQR